MKEPIQIELPTIFQMKTVNAWLFLEPEPVLIDCGEKTEASWNALEIGLQKFGIGVKDLKKVIITHAHVDHIGMAGKITEHSDATIWVSDLVYEWAVNLETLWAQRSQMILSSLEKTMGQSEVGLNMIQLVQAFLKFPSEIWDTIPTHRIQTFPIDSSLQFGNAIWQVMHTPGHSFNQTVFYDPKSKFLLSADMLLAITPTPVIDTVPDNPQERNKGLIQLLESYDKLTKIEISKVFPGHYRSFENAHETIKYQVNRIHQRKEECFQLIQSGVQQFLELFQKMYSNNMNLAGTSMLIGYLDLLIKENRIFQKMEEKELRYFVKDNRKINLHFGKGLAE